VDSATKLPVNTGLLRAWTGRFYAVSYGADPTGMADSGPAINAAIADAKVAGGVVELGPGVFKIGTTINLSGIHTAYAPNTGASVTLRGAGMHSTYLTGGETSYGFIELVGSNRVTIEGMTMVSTGTIQFGVLGGRTTGNASSGEHVFRHVGIYGAFSQAALFMMSSEMCSYDRLLVYTTAGAGAVLARDLRGWSSVTAKYTALSSTTAIVSGNGVNRIANSQFLTTGLSATDYPLVLEYIQTGSFENIYTISSGAPLVLLSKKCAQVSFKGLHQEWNSGIGGATEPYGIYCSNVVLSGEQQDIRMSITGSSCYPVYGEDNVVFADFTFIASQWRGTKSWMFDSYISYNASINYDSRATSISEVSTPRYRVRGAGADNQYTPNSFTTTNRNLRTNDLGPGTQIFDTTLNKPLWSSVAGWRDATGTLV